MLQVTQIQPLDGRVVDIEKIVRRAGLLMQGCIVFGFPLAVLPDQWRQVLDKFPRVKGDFVLGIPIPYPS